MHARSNYASRIEVSPSGEWLAFRENFHVYVMPMPPGGTIDLSPKTKSLPIRRASDVGGEYSNWIDGDTLTWTLGPALYRGEMSTLFAKPGPPTGNHPTGTPTSEGVEPPPVYGQRIADLGSSRAADKPVGVLALTGAASSP